MDFDQDYKHTPVLVGEVVLSLRPQDRGVFVDATLGEGGHAEALLRATAPNGRLIGIDRDGEVLEIARQRLGAFGSRVAIVHGHTAELRNILDTLRIEQVDGVLLDLGVSSYQLEIAARGFSFMREGPLDMRMDRTAERTAATLVNMLEEWELVNVIMRYGEERWARRIARAISRARRRAPLQTTQDTSGHHYPSDSAQRTTAAYSSRHQNLPGPSYCRQSRALAARGESPRGHCLSSSRGTAMRHCLSLSRGSHCQEDLSGLCPFAAK